MRRAVRIEEIGPCLGQEEIRTDPSQQTIEARADRKARVAAQQAERKRIQSEINKLSKQRDAYLDKAEKEAGVDEAFDGKVLDSVKKRAKSIGVDY